ncbi:MAG: hypothetical protein R3E64_07430 [Halioglobus sp.]
MSPRVLILWFSYSLAAASFASDYSDEHHFIEVWLDPPKAAVGEHIRLNLMIGVDSYFSAATDLALPDIEHALVLHDQPAINGAKDIGGKYFTTQLHQIDIYPGREGIMVVPAFQVTFTQAVEVNGELSSQSVRLDTEQLLGLIQVPPVMQGEAGFMVSPHVQVSDEWEGTRDDEYQVGDVLTRVVVLTASDMAAMNMPQFTPRVPRGVSVTLAEPSLSSSSGREDTAATMEQHMSYAIEAPGRYRLGGEVLSWWDPVKAARQDHRFAEVPVNAGGLPWRMMTIAAILAATMAVLALALRRYLRRRDATDLAIRQRLCSKDARERLAALYAYADYHQPRGGEPVRLRELLSSSDVLIDKVLAAQFSAASVGGEPSRAQSKALYRKIRKKYAT